MKSNTALYIPVGIKTTISLPAYDLPPSKVFWKYFVFTKKLFSSVKQMPSILFHFHVNREEKYDVTLS